MPWYRQRVEVPRPLVAAAIAALLVLALLAMSPIGSALAALGAHATPAPTTARFAFPTPVPATPTPSPNLTPTLIAPSIGPAPSNCPPGSPPVEFSPAVSPGIGGSDVWLVGPVTGPRSTARIGLLPPNVYTQFGWPVQIPVLVKVGFAQTISLRGHDLHTGYALWLTPGPPEAAMPALTIDPGQLQSSTSDGQWRIWFGVMYLPGAGCYALHASWPGGGWTVNFAAGR